MATLENERGKQAEGENRVLTMLFADLCNSVEVTAGLDPEDVAERVNAVFEVMVGAILKYGGRVNRLLGDEVLAFFGAPEAHEDDPERALLAALELRERVRGLGLDVTLGINTGEVYLGAMGAAAHQEWTAMGRAINLAARLRSAAQPGQVLVGAETYRQTRRAFTFVGQTLHVKGIAEPVRAYEVVALAPAPEKARGIEGFDTPFVGRELDLQRLTQCVPALGSGQGQVVTVVGEAGIGKSRLVAELRAWAEAHLALFWLEGHSTSLDATVGYAPFLDAFRRYFGWRPDDDALARGASLRATLDDLVACGVLTADRRAAMQPVLGHLLTARFAAESPDPGDVHLRHLPPDQLKTRIFEAVREFILALSRRGPVVLALEDLHWADDLSLDLTAALMDVAMCAPVMLLCVYRPEHEHRCWQLGRIAHDTVDERHLPIALELLPRAQTRQLVDALMPGGIPEPVTELVLTKAQGNPFFAEELLRALIESGMLFQAQGIWQAREGIEVAILPETIQSLILSRVDHLAPETRRALQIAAVIGRVFRERLLAELVRSASDLPQALHDLEARALIRAERTSADTTYAFQHVLTQETVYHNILRRRRAVFHRRVAEVMEALYADDLAAYYEQLAYHYDHSDKSEKAVEYLRKAGEKAAGLYANDQAIVHYQRALDRLLTSPAPADPEGRRELVASLREELGDVLALIGQYDAARDAYRAALPETLGATRARVLRKMGRAWENQRAYDDAVGAFLEAERALGPEPGENQAAWWQEWTEIQIGLIQTYYWRNQVEAMTAVADRALPRVERWSRADQRARFYWVLVQRNFRRDRMTITPETLAYGRAAMQAILETEDPAQIVFARFGLGFSLLWYGALDEAEQELQTALRLAQRMNDVVFQGRCLTYLTVLYRKRGDVDRVREYVGKSMALAESARMSEYMGTAEANAAWLAWRTGNLDAAEQHARTAVDTWGQVTRVEMFPWLAHWPLLGAAMTRARWAEALEHARSLLSPLIQPPPAYLATPLAAAISAWDHGRLEQVEARLGEAIRLARSEGYL